MNARESAQRQAEELTNHPETRDRAKSLYASIDALDSPSRRLLVAATLQRASESLNHLISSDGEADRAVAAQTMHGMIAIAGYANEQTREDAGETSTGDSRVADVLNQYRDVLESSFREAMSPEDQARADSVLGKARARQEAGEDFNTALQQEMAQAGVGEDTTPDTERETVEHIGMYL